MAAGIPIEKLRRRVRYLTKKHGRPYTFIRASNGECAILPACRTCGKTSPSWAPCEHERTAADDK